MADNLEHYHGREQSYIKHLFLTQYLMVAAYKTLQGRSKIFNFIDAFAGPWCVSDDDYSDASFDQALRTLEDVRRSLVKKGFEDLKIRFCFCERQTDAATKLRDYAASRKHFEIHVFEGAFEDQLNEIASVCREGFTFTFIDPTGWDIRSEPIFKFLKDRKGEFLLNFMAEHINRHAGYSGVTKSFGRFLADPDWSEEFNALPSNLNNEQRILHLLRQKIKEMDAAIYVADFPILKPLDDRVKMRLLLGTRSAKGLEVFRDVQEKVEREEIKTYKKLRDGNRSQVSLFTDDEILAMEQQASGVGCSKFKREAKKRIVKKLSEGGAQPFFQISTDILEFVPMRLTQIKKLMNKMKARGVVTFELLHGKRVPQKDTKISLVQ